MIYLALDVGTTHTRVWLLKNQKVLACTRQPVGVRTTAITGDSSPLSRALRDAIRSLDRAARRPRFVLAAGMITSPQGLHEVPHVVAPAGRVALQERVRMKVFPALCPHPFFLVPGVRIHPAPAQLESIGRTDIIRGEESEIVGLQALGKLQGPCFFLHLGSHTKGIQIDSRDRIARSVTTLAGECLDVFRTQTILSDHLPRVAGVALNERFLRSGARLLHRYGLLRTLFMIRLLGENRGYTRSQLHSFLLGAIVASDLQALENSGFLRSGRQHILLSGHRQWQRAWGLILGRKNYQIKSISPRERDAAFLEGLRTIVFESRVFQRFARRGMLELIS